MFLKKRGKKGRRASRERRREPRYPEGIEITLVPQKPTRVRGGTRSYNVRMKDVSPGGFRVESFDFIPIGTVLAVNLKSSKTRKDIRATAEVKWITEAKGGKTHEIGLEFVETTVRSIMDIVEHIYKG